MWTTVVSRASVEQPEFVGANEDKPGFIQPAAPGSPEHLEDFVGLHRERLRCARKRNRENKD